MSTTLDLINAIEAGDSENIETHFDYLMTARIAERLDDKRVEVARNMFKESVNEESKDSDNLDEDVTPEDIKEFMQTEEFEQLDEISKDTLRSYLDKSIETYGKDGEELKDKQKKGEDTSKVKTKIKNRLNGQMKAYNKLKA